MASMAELARQLLGLDDLRPEQALPIGIVPAGSEPEMGAGGTVPIGSNYQIQPMSDIGGVSADRYMEIMDRSPYSTGVPVNIGYGEEAQMSPLDAAALVTGGVPVVGDVTGLAADVDMYMRDPESRNIPNYLLTAAGVVPFVPAASQVRKGIKAYHGSPHSFDRFSTEQIGTGEGAQAYGQGLYFAESEDVARGYREKLSRDNLAQRAKDNQSYDTLVGLGLDESPDLGDFSIILSEADGDMARAIQDSMTPRYPDDPLPAFAQSMADAMKSGRLPASIELPTLNKGSMYEVNINVEPDELIDWYKPLDEQSDKVSKVLSDAFRSTVKDPDGVAVMGFDGEIVDRASNYSPEEWKLAEKTYRKLGNKISTNLDLEMKKIGSGMGMHEALQQRLGGADKVAEYLQSKGVKGVRYADAFTRHKSPDKQSMNYVIFDDRLISIAKKYGVAIPVAAAMLARATGEDTSQSFQEET